MKFNSTRGGVVGLSFADSILSGYAADGGILLPESISQVPRDELISWSTLSYAELCKKILPIFIDDSEISSEEISGIIDKSFTEFETDDVVTLTQLEPGVHIGELFHGPTGAFKDLALSVLGQCLELVLARRKSKVTILVGTSGDTGSAAIRSVRGSPWASIIVLYPDKMISEIQRLQMTTVDAANVQVFAVEGTSDDLDVPIRDVFRDAPFVAAHRLCSVNSINVGRVLFQCVHYVFFYLRLCGGGGDLDLERRLLVYVPTGAAGHLAAGCIARRLTGLDLRLVACVNENDIMHRWLRSGVFEPSGAVTPTSSNAMDIQVPYNIERLLFYLSGGDCALVRSLMGDLETGGSFSTPPALRAAAAEFLSSRRVTEPQRMEVMRDVCARRSYVLCPHTAVAVRAALDDRAAAAATAATSSSAPEPCLCLATATAAKFEPAVRKAGVTADVRQPESWRGLGGAAEHGKRMARGEDWEARLREAIRMAGSSAEPGKASC